LNVTQTALCMLLMQELVRRLCHMSVEFDSELMRWTDDEYYSAHVHKIQLPFNQVLSLSLSLSLSCRLDFINWSGKCGRATQKVEIVKEKLGEVWKTYGS